MSALIGSGFFDLTAALGMIVLIMLAWRSRDRRGSGWLIAASISGAWMALTEGLLRLGPDPATGQLIAQLQYLGTTTVVPFAVLYVLSRSSQTTARIRPVMILGIALVPALTLVFVWTNARHGWMWPTIVPTAGPVRGQLVLVFEHGPVFWIFYAWCVALITVTCVVQLLRALHGSVLQRRQSLAYVIALVFPLLGATVTVFGLSPWPTVDLTTFGINVSVAALVWGHLRGRMVDLVPFARHQAFDHIDDAIFVFDDAHRLVDLNATANALVLSADGTSGPLMGLTRGEVERRAGGSHSRTDGRRYGVRDLPLRANRGGDVGLMVVWHDITETYELQRELERRADTDALTGADSRRGFLESGRVMFDRAVATRTSLTLVMVDLDHFKLVNDTYGHPVGDEVLVAAVRGWRAAIAAVPGARLGRLGGEEFACLLPGVGAGAAAGIVADLVTAVRSLGVTDGDGNPVAVTCSAGVAEPVPGDGRILDLVIRADEALYAAKRAGRDRASFAGVDVPAGRGLVVVGPSAHSPSGIAH